MGFNSGLKGLIKVAAGTPAVCEMVFRLTVYRNLIVIQISTLGVGGTRWRSWLRHCATSRKVAGSIPDGVIEKFHFYNPSDRTIALGLTQPLTEMNTRNTSWE